MDLSYLSLSVAVPVVASLLVQDDPDREIVALVKPLFEVPASGPDLSREQYEAALRRACRAGTEAGMRPSAAMASPVLGSSGTLEFLVLFRPLQERMQAGSEQDPEREPGFGFPIDDMIAEALDEEKQCSKATIEGVIYCEGEVGGHPRHGAGRRRSNRTPTLLKTCACSSWAGKGSSRHCSGRWGSSPLSCAGFRRGAEPRSR